MEEVESFCMTRGVVQTALGEYLLLCFITYHLVAWAPEDPQECKVCEMTGWLTLGSVARGTRKGVPPIQEVLGRSRKAGSLRKKLHTIMYEFLGLPWVWLWPENSTQNFLKTKSRVHLCLGLWLAPGDTHLLQIDSTAKIL